MALVNINFTVLAHAYVLYARALQSRIGGGTFAAPVRPALKSGTAMRTTVKSGTAFAVPAGPSTPPLFISCDGHQLYYFKERSIDLEVEAVHYIEMHRRPHMYWARLLQGARVDLELDARGRSQCVLVKIWRSTWNTYWVWCLNVVVI